MTYTKTASLRKAFTHVKTSYPELGISTRSKFEGSESDLVASFLSDSPWEVPTGNHLTIFEQPKLESGYPDIVLVLWDLNRTGSWPVQRLALGPADIRVMHYLSTSGPAATSDLLSIFGPRIQGSLERLSAADTIHCECGLWCPRGLEEIFAVKQIVAFEAKLAAPAAAIAQASRNRWFASHSYIIVPKKPRDTGPIRKANQFGVGIWSLHDTDWVCHAPSAVEAIPRSYASWLFNEWVWRLDQTNLAAALTGA